MTETIRGRRRLWPRGPSGTVRWAVLEPVLLAVRHYLGNPVRNGYLARLLAIGVTESVESRLLDGMFRPVTTAQGYALRGPRDMVEGRFEPAVTRLVSRLADAHDVFLDVGAHVGYYTCLARSRGCDVVAVEPDPVSLFFLLRNLTSNGWDDVRVHAAAVGPVRGTGFLYGRALCTSLVPGWADAGPRARHMVTIQTLGDVAPAAGRSMLVKLDVEGCEFDALAAAGELLSRTPAPCWVVENCPTEPNPGGRNPHFGDLFGLFFAHGYRAWEITGAQEPVLVPVTPERVRSWVERDMADVATWNYLFVRDDSCRSVLADLDARGDRPAGRGRT